MLSSGFQRYNFHTNVEWEIKKGLNFGINITYGRSKQRGLTTTEEQVFNSSPFSAGITNSFVYALLMPPVVSVYNADGSYNFNNPYEYAYFAIGNHTANPVYDLKESVAENINNYLLSNAWVTYQLGNFHLKAALGLNTEKLTQNYFSGAYTSLGLATEGIGGTGNRQTDIWQQEQQILPCFCFFLSAKDAQRFTQKKWGAAAPRETILPMKHLNTIILAMVLAYTHPKTASASQVSTL